MSLPPEDWPRVLDRLLSGDKVAFLKLNRMITGFLVQLRAYGLREDWDDLRQEVILSLVANARAGRLREPEKLLSYLRIITRNKFADRLEKKTRRHESGQLSFDDLLPDQIPTVSADGHAQDVWWEVGKLTAQHQEVLDGIYRQGKTYEEVARDSGIPLGTVKRRLSEGLATLRERLRGNPGKLDLK